MPHIVIEYAKLLDNEMDMHPLLRELHYLLAEQETVKIEAIKSRLYPCERFLVGEQDDDIPFVHVTVSILTGRSPELKQHFATVLHAAVVRELKRSLPPYMDYIATLEVREMQKECYISSAK